VIDPTPGPSWPACPHAARCSGCTRLAEPYDAQLLAKHDRLAQAVGGYPILAPTIASKSGVIRPTVGADPVAGYRTRAKWVVGPGGKIGLFAREGDHELVDLAGCMVVAPVIEAVGQAMRGLLRSAPFLKVARSLRALDVREVIGDDGPRALVTLVVDRARFHGEEPLVALAQALQEREPRVAGVGLNLVDKLSPQLLGPRTTPLRGEAEVRDRIGSARTLVTFGSFVQAHRGQAARLYERIAALAPRRGRVLDLYGGSGSLALALAGRGLTVDTVESFEPASRAAGRAAEGQKLAVQAIAGDAGEVAARLAAEGKRYDLVVVNPPRRGLSPEVRAAVAAIGAPRVAYLSCEPGTLARDLAHLAVRGYWPASLEPHDMIPLTEEVETLAVIERGEVPPARVLAEAKGAVFVEKMPHEPTTPQGEHASSLLARVRMLPGYEAAVPVHRLDVGTSGVCLFARTPADVAPWSKALSEAAGHKVYLAGARGITAPRGVIHRPLREEGAMIEACTRYRRLEVVGGHSLLAVRPEHGRTHQIRRHLEGLGHPVLGDERYGHAPSNRHFYEKYGLDRAFLHCLVLALVNPHDGSALRVVCPPASDLPWRAALERGEVAVATFDDRDKRDENP
jgi:23S rRNA (uracil1939-C5)-methyltransferase